MGEDTTPQKEGSADAMVVPARTPGPLSAWALLAVTSILAGILVAPGFECRRCPSSGRRTWAVRWRGFSAAGFKAARDYDLPDAVLTERRRQEARAGVRPVFDFNPAVVPEERAAVREAFEELRRTLARLDAESGRATETPSVSAGSPPRPKLRTPGRKRSDHLDGIALDEARLAFELRLFEIDDDDWRALVDARGSRWSRRCSRCWSAASSRRGGGPGGPRPLGTSILSEISPTAPSIPAPSPPAVLDVREARGEMDRWASLPGNLLPDAPPLLRRAVLRIAKRALRPDLTPSIAETERRRSAAAAGVKDAVIQVKKGQRIIGDGELVTEAHLRLVAAMRAQTDRFDAVEASVGTAALVALPSAGCGPSTRRLQRRPTRRDGLLLGAILLGLLATFGWG
jgi:hypothetical protein